MKREKLILTPTDMQTINFDFCCEELRQRYIKFPQIGSDSRLIIINEDSNEAFAISANMLHDTEMDKVKEALWDKVIEKIEKCPFCGKRLFIY